MPHSDFTSFFTDPVMSLIISTFKHVGLSLKDISKLQGLCGHAKVTPAIHRLSHLDVKRLCHTHRICVCVRAQKQTENRQT